MGYYYLVVYEDNGDMAFSSSLPWLLDNLRYTRPCTIYEVRLTRRKHLRHVPVDRKVLIDYAVKLGSDPQKKLANVRNPFKGKPGLPEGSQHITTDESGELVIRPYKEAA